MFAGLIEEVGRVVSFGRGRLRVSSSLEVQVGDSVAVNGVCLTLVSKENFLEFEVSEETLKRSNLKRLKEGDFVNLERALKVGGRVGGHFVLGHVDYEAKILKFYRKNSHHHLEVQLREEFRDLVVEKGSVALDGISLTVNEVKDYSFTINVIPYTYQKTNLKYKKVGDYLNVELDILGKYVQRFLKRRMERKLGKNFGIIF